MRSFISLAASLVNVTHKNDYQVDVKNIIQNELQSLLNVLKYNYNIFQIGANVIIKLIQKYIHLNLV